MTPDEFLGRDGETAFAFGRHLHGAFGGVFGGALAAATLRVARTAVPGRTPASLDCRFVRALPAGRAHAKTAVVHAGRSMTTVAVDLVDEGERVTTHATITLVDVTTLAPVTREAGALGADDANGRVTPWRNPPGIEAPIIATLTPTTVARDDGETTTVTTAVDVPWEDEIGAAAAEAVCLAADLCVGPPVAAACRGRRLAHPNPDVSLRFAASIAAGVPVVATGRLAALDHGLAAVAIDVTAAGRAVATGASFSVLLETS